MRSRSDRHSLPIFHRWQMQPARFRDLATRLARMTTFRHPELKRFRIGFKDAPVDIAENHSRWLTS
jgi:hypothetical protein